MRIILIIYCNILYITCDVLQHAYVSLHKEREYEHTTKGETMVVRDSNI